MLPGGEGMDLAAPQETDQKALQRLWFAFQFLFEAAFLRFAWMSTSHTLPTWHPR